ncbi:hypothetical protein NVP1084O_183 [Vibrio phage 1.084.O._10N.261.49.F5]|nr:hypothetical protein NVP1084O_183 [Vibrio phage 1.084.O._10N.261.49.F5]
MSKFAQKSFAPSTQSSGNSGGNTNVDWDGLNKHVAESVQEVLGCDEGSPAAAIGIISGIVDYGKHQDPERVEPMDEGDVAAKKWKSDMVSKGKAENRDGVFHYQAAPCQEVGIFVDFPSVSVDKGQFFGDSNPAPYRVLLGGVFKGEPAQKTKIQGYPNDQRVWVFGDKNRATKLAKAGKLPNLKDGFAQDRLLELIGKAMTFNVEVFVNDAGFLQEKVTNPSPVMAGIPLPTIDEDLLFYVGLNEDNEDTYVKYLTKPVKEYCKLALDFEGSKLAAQLEALESSQQATIGLASLPSAQEKSAEKVAQKQEVPVKQETPVYNDMPDFDSEIPF